MPQRSIRFQGERWFKCKEDKGIILPLTGKEPLGRLTWLHEVASVGVQSPAFRVASCASRVEGNMYFDLFFTCYKLPHSIERRGRPRGHPETRTSRAICRVSNLVRTRFVLTEFQPVSPSSRIAKKKKKKIGITG